MTGEKKAVIALTMGDPAGIGPELLVRAAAETDRFEGAVLVAYGEKSILQEAADRFSGGKLPAIVECGKLPFSQLKIGEATAEAGKLSLNVLDRAGRDALAGTVDAVVTAPMNKYAVNLAGIPFSGHTEYLAELTGTKHFVMMQSAGNLRMVFVSTHIPISEVPGALSVERIVEVGTLLADAVRAEGIADPLFCAAALNPHAGENGCMGDEEIRLIRPAIEEMKKRGIRVEGPAVPDVLFIEDVRRRYDGLITMYHDQGHIPFKMLAFNRGVNSTLGLPIIRTSPDHGTAYDRAWKGTADCGSFFAAIDLAVKRAKNR